ncbi:DNA-directed RNA polymerase I subunit rpa2, partial [Linderina pennispora]
MYQAQMGKQTMGSPMQSYPYRTDNKLYRIQNGQTPICRPRVYDDYGVDGYPNGNNAVVAVISYTGYDMEDAMILNKSAHERGFGYGSIYKTEYVDLGKFRKSGDPITTHFGLGPDVLHDTSLNDRIDVDGLPFPGIRVTNGDTLYGVIDDVRGRTKIMKYKGEDGFVESVRLLASSMEDELQTVAITFRIPRSPVIGDKFSSRHGQKGVCSVKFPATDMPFTESGMQPDVIINPHAFPSRMTIGMFVESIAAKAGALHGVCQDATPFTFDETNTAADYFGEQLRQAGYNYHGNEPMYSGVTGQEMRADIYIGVVYYQRLRHMVSDKYQVRTTGPINPLTQQPIKGRKRGGGIRLGEMERDALIAHGAAYFLQDRLLNCSDYSLAYVCKCCGSMLAPVAVPASSHTVDLTKGKAGRALSAAEARAIMSAANGPRMGK